MRYYIGTYIRLRTPTLLHRYLDTTTYRYLHTTFLAHKLLHTPKQYTSIHTHIQENKYPQLLLGGGGGRLIVPAMSLLTI